MYTIRLSVAIVFFFFFQAEDGIRDYKVTGVQTCALPICARWRGTARRRDILRAHARAAGESARTGGPSAYAVRPATMPPDRKSTRLNSSHLLISYAVFCF